MKPTPAVRDDGQCVTCLGPRSIHKDCKDARRAAVKRDPFCSTECARQYHGVVFKQSDITTLGAPMREQWRVRS